VSVEKQANDFFFRSRSGRRITLFRQGRTPNVCISADKCAISRDGRVEVYAIGFGDRLARFLAVLKKARHGANGSRVGDEIRRASIADTKTNSEAARYLMEPPEWMI